MGISLHHYKARSCSILWCLCRYLFSLFLLALFRLWDVFGGPKGHQIRVVFLAMMHNP